MTITMQGTWSLTNVSKSASYKQRIVISGSDNADNTYPYPWEDELIPPDAIEGEQWGIQIQHKPASSTEWLPSDERLNNPRQIGSNVEFDILSNDSGGDEDYNDLVITCSKPENAYEFVVYGRVRTYSGDCRINPCLGRDIVIETADQLRAVLNIKDIRPIVERIYPARVKNFLKQEKKIRGPIPQPDPVPFRPMIIPLSDKQNVSKRVTTIQRKSIQSTKADISSSLNISGAANQQVAVSTSEALALARIRDSLRLRCLTQFQPGLLLRFLEYDPTAAELAGGPYTGEGNRQILGYAVTDEQGRYIFRFNWEFSDIGDEFEEQLAGTTTPEIALRPDLLVQVISGMGEDLQVLFESPLRSNIANLQRINLCFPESELHTGPSGCQGGRSIQAIGNIWTIAGVGNSIDWQGRITATHDNGPKLTRGAWHGRLDIFACFENESVEYYTIRYRRRPLGGTIGDWHFIDQVHKHVNVNYIGDIDHGGHKVGPDDHDATIDGVATEDVPFYLNIEDSPDWILAHRTRKLQFRSWRIVPASSPETIELKIEGYDNSYNKLAGAEDSIRLYIDNSGIEGDIESISMADVTPGRCAFFELPSPNEPLVVRFKVHQNHGFAQNYKLKVMRGSIDEPVNVVDSSPHSYPLEVSYDETEHGNHFFGTENAEGVDSEGYIVAELQPDGGAPWLPDTPFCAFAVEIHAQTRSTNGYNLDDSDREEGIFIGISNPTD